ncbi:MAG: methyltransferase domain-containing protein [Candidatus Bipolaricaulota bacterium]|nr:methyltransferase domain-containing protein [Candidatus Bipolaricaulota bacterium]MCS7273991.1 methyltransferase domain-containing protein [Candidatus Bipolaricaulota bacterium]MDW8111344.1 methyltransferase domain-containing protein [Candidatus Bipolaricaulota bacterium]MDW8329236.1 methyltransferase domain-containing protein [Candidatus Bipolaricaulota bacterium]
MTLMKPTEQKEQVRSVFTQAADSYVRHKGEADRASHEAMLRLSRVQPSDRVLDIGCGPGFVTLLFAERAQEAIGLDLTPAFLERARQRQEELGLKNVRFLEGDAEQMPFEDSSFTIVISHKAFHHFANPRKILSEVHRVLRPQGRLVLGDTISSDDPSVNSVHNELERLRDPSHVKMYGLRELQELLTSAGFRMTECEVLEDERTFEWWMSVITPPPEVIARIRQTLIEDIAHNRTGLAPRLDGETLWLKRRAAVLVAVRR